MKGFSVGLALVDYIPVAAFGVAMIFVGNAIGNPLFYIGAVFTLLGGLVKATWKLILGISGKDIKILNKGFWPLMGLGFLLMIVGVVISLFTKSWEGFGAAILSLPQVIFFAIFIVAIAAMMVFKKTSFKKDSARDNWIAEIINCIGMVSLLIGSILAV
ncbi:MAG: hypothetical protein HUJ75_06985 [Parasporobacterium sp.]|nr:hypothetical protein [Parasporobacterium sp.]